MAGLDILQHSNLSHKYLQMAILANIIILSLCVFHVDCRYIGRSSVKHMVMHKRSIDDGVKESKYCYDEFVGLYFDNAATYHGVCKSRHKLKLCKDKVNKAYPSIEKDFTKGYEDEKEMIADFWCTYNTTHHGPHEPFINMADMYRKYRQCPYVAHIMLTHEDYSPRIRLGRERAQIANAILTLTGTAGLSLWQHNRQYSDPHDPVYKALSAWMCDWYKYRTYLSDHIMSRYCVIVKNISRELHDVLYTYDRHSDGLYNWTTSLCTEYDDVLEQVMRISRLDKWLSHQKKSDLPPCHDHNIYIKGATCLIMFHTTLPPYSGLHNVMPPFVKNIAELNSCWNRVTSGCPQTSSASRNMSLIIEIYNLASDISKQDSDHVWDVIWSWSDSYKKMGNAQWILQALYQLLKPGPPSHSSFPLGFGSSLEAALHNTSSPPHIKAVFSKLSSALDKVSVVGNDAYLGVNILEGFYSMNEYVLGLLLQCFNTLYELFVEVGEFVQYKGLCPEWWPPPCGA